MSRSQLSSARHQVEDVDRVTMQPLARYYGIDEAELSSPDSRHRPECTEQG
jgi:hypothetical protein